MALDYSNYGSAGYGQYDDPRNRFLNQQLARDVTVSAGSAMPSASLAPAVAAGGRDLNSGARINPDESRALSAFTPFSEYIDKRFKDGIGWLPMPTPSLTFRESRDSDTGDYISRSLDADFSGVPAELRDMYGLYLEPLRGRLSAAMNDENRVRSNVRANTPFVTAPVARVSESFSFEPGIDIPDSMNPNWGPGYPMRNQGSGSAVYSSGPDRFGSGGSVPGSVRLGDVINDYNTGNSYLAEARYPGAYAPRGRSSYNIVYDNEYGALPLTGNYMGLM